MREEERGAIVMRALKESEADDDDDEKEDDKEHWVQSKRVEHQAATPLFCAI